MGSPAFAVPALEAVAGKHDVRLVVTQPDRPAGRGKRLAPPPVKEAAERAGIPVIQPRATKKPAFASELAAVGADVGVVVAYGRILPKRVLDVFPQGCLNIHASLLPSYRGAAPVPWAIIRGERETGVSIMRLDEGMDTGPVLATERVQIDPHDTAGSLTQRLAPLGANLLLDVLRAVEEGSARETPQDDAQATYAPPLDKRAGVVDWSRPARAVCDLIRGVDPWPGATTTASGEPLKLFAPSVASDEAGAAPAEPGRILAVNDSIVVACGEGAARVGEVQAPGKRRIAAGDFARGRRLSPGVRLGT